MLAPIAFCLRGALQCDFKWDAYWLKSTDSTRIKLCWMDLWYVDNNGPHLPFPFLWRTSQNFYIKCRYYLGYQIWHEWKHDCCFNWPVLSTCRLVLIIYSSRETFLLWWVFTCIILFISECYLQLHPCFWFSSFMFYRCRLVLTNQHDWLLNAVFRSNKWSVYMKWWLC